MKSAGKRGQNEKDVKRIATVTSLKGESLYSCDLFNYVTCLNMAVSIRLRREGAKNRPYYKIVVADSRSPRDGKFIEIIGTYDPKTPGNNSSLKVERAEYWISKGAQPSDTVRSLIKRNKKIATAAEPLSQVEQGASQLAQEQVSPPPPPAETSS